ncbi:FKBP-type peptidyl-prolyl cis-trans isomerase [Sphingomonas sp. ID0503]|uniref:FKBP-type peptidyl-prolyl cis-trans isomerase n=1 Tax=Sphingomonas sp. ID0503 TaxID=3399691 RepID=UPI003AFAD4E7
MSITAVPLHPIKKGSLTKLWIGIAALAIVGGAVAIAQTSDHHGPTAVATSGIKLTTLKDGKGPAPTDADLVQLHYTGKLASDGTVFDSTSGGEPAVFPVQGLIPGFTEGLKLMHPGGKYRLFIPAALGYGAEQAGPIPPNSDLVFDVELLAVQPGVAR